MNRIAIRLLIPVLGLCLAAPAAAQRTFSEEVDTVVVEIPVQVMDRDGNPVRGLTAADFEIFDGRKKQRITGLEVIDLENLGIRPDDDPVPVAGRRHFLFLFDLSFSDPVSVTRARAAARQVLFEGLHPEDLVGVATYSLQQGPRLVLGFTTDRRQADLAIETLGFSQLIEQFNDPLGLILADPGQMRAGLETGTTQTTGRTGADFQGMLVENLQDMGREMQKSSREERSGQVQAFVQGLEDLARVLTSVQGRKHVVLLSEGVDTSLLLGTENLGRVEEMAQASADGRYWEIDSQERYGSSAAVNVLERVLEEIRRADAVVQAVDIGGLRAGQGRTQTQDSLLTFAKSTGGEMFANTNDLALGMSEMLERTSVTYLLAFQPEDLEFDGSYHRLRVKLNGGPRGAQLVHRPGFYAPRPYAERSAMERRFEASEKIVEGRSSGALGTSILAAPFPGDPGSSWVPLLVEVDGEDLLRGGKGKVLPIEVYVYALDQEGGVQAVYTKSLGLEREKVEGALRQSGLKLFGSIDLEPGDYTIRVLVREGLSGRSALRTTRLQVPERSSPRPVLLSPLFPEQPNKWLMVHDVDTARERGIPYPFMMGGAAFVPAARPSVRAGTDVPLALVAYHLGQGAMEVSWELLDGQAQRVAGAPMEVSSPSENGSAFSFSGMFEPDGVVPGEYTFVVTVKQGEHEISSSTPLVVES